jgi:uncharacterized phage protein (TIGR01671 family)
VIPKFRAFHKEKKRIYEVARMNFYGSCFLVYEHEESFGDDEREVELMQWTGLVDRNDQEIYTGHIVKFTKWWFDGQERETELIGEIIYEPENMAFALKGIKNKEWLRHIGGDINGTFDTACFNLFNFDQADFEVIGNRYLNPELLEGAVHG